MTKAEIVAKVAEQVKVTKKVADEAFQTIIGCIEGALKKGEKTTIVGFGTFSVADRKARKGRNPQTGKEIKIAAKKVPKFSAGLVLKAVVNGKTIAKKAAAKPKKK
jgi:DNA-binding protein HU-beta